MGLMLALAKPKKKSAEPEAEEGGGEGLDVAAADLIAAVKAGDEKGVAAALRSAYEMCSSE